MPGFHDIQFPSDISYGSSGGPMFSTTIMALNSGFERRNINWATVRGAYNAVQGIKSREQMDELISFFYARMGRAYSFRYKDWADYQTGVQIIGHGNATNTAFQMTKTYVSGDWSYTRMISKPVEGTLVDVSVNGVALLPADYTVDWNTGIITLDTAPANTLPVAIANVEFDVHARFDTDSLPITHDFWETMSWPDIPIVEIKEQVA